MTNNSTLFMPGEQKGRRPRKQPQIEQSYTLLLYNAANNAMAHAPRKAQKYKLDRKAGIRTGIFGRLTMRILDGGKPLAASAHRLLDFLMLELSRHNELKGVNKTTAIRIDFDELAAAFGKTDGKSRQRLRKQVQDDLERIYQVEVHYQNTARKDELKGRIISEYRPFEKDRRHIEVNFAPVFVSYMTNRYIMPFNRKLLAISGNYPNAYPIGRKLDEHYTSIPMRRKGTYDRLAVLTLLKAAPDIPTFEEVRDNHKREYSKLIINPLEIALEQLVKEGIIYEWTYWKARNIPLTDAELATADYELLKNCYIHWLMPEPVGLPERTPVKNKQKKNS